MSQLSRRKLITTALGTTAGVTGIAVAARLAQRNGLTPPEWHGMYGPGDTMTYAAQKLLTRRSMAREFSRDQISKTPFPNETSPPSEAFKRLQAAGFADWRLVIEGMVARPTSLSLADIRSYPSRSQITHLACEEGWSYVAEWIGAPLFHVLKSVGVLPQAKYVVFHSIEKGWADSIDMADALHPQTFVAYGMNGGELPVGFGGPLRMRVPRQLGYKSVKFINRLTVTDSKKALPPPGDYSWYAGI
ncbi:MAG: molybdopterin-dependent oxidoreductase [Acidobacteriota bacterium]|nr:molybdopterin-dependent oxidoreductase [Acidobacteriota bacterium]